MKSSCFIINAPINNQPIILCSAYNSHIRLSVYPSKIYILNSLDGKLHVEQLRRIKKIVREKCAIMVGSDELNPLPIYSIDQQSMEWFVAPGFPDTEADITIGECTKFHIHITWSCNGSKLLEPVQFLHLAPLDHEVTGALHWRYSIVERLVIDKIVLDTIDPGGGKVAMRKREKNSQGTLQALMPEDFLRRWLASCRCRKRGRS